MAADRAIVNVSASVLTEDAKVSVGGTIVHEIADGAGDVSQWISYAIDIDTSTEVVIPTGIGYLNDTGKICTRENTSSDKKLRGKLQL